MHELVTNNRRRSRQAVMSNEDNAALTELLRQKVSPLQFLYVDFNARTIRELDSLVDKNARSIYVTSPEPGDRSLEELKQVLRRVKYEAQFWKQLPRRHFLYHPLRGFRRGWSRPREKAGVEVEVSVEAFFHFVYDKDDPVAHAFSEKILRLLNKFLVHHFAVVNAETGEVVHEIRRGSTRWAGPHVVESCRRTPRRYLDISFGSGPDGEMLCIAPLPPGS